jgi:release factor glutamine methyltransferase
MRALKKDRAWLLTHPEAILEPADLAQYKEKITRRQQHEPIQYILGEQEFFSLTLRVTPDVLIPRPETEHLVEALLARVPHHAPLRIADIGTGSGAIAVALAHALPHTHVTALDVSKPALAVARQNAERHGVTPRMRVLQSDLLEAVRSETFDAIVSNPPYVATSEILEPQVRDFEPHSALFAGPTGLEIYQRLIPQAQEALVPGGWLLLEIGHSQREALIQLLASWDEITFIPDLQQIPRVAIARRSNGQ